MTPWKRKFNPGYAFELMRIAESDLETATILNKVTSGSPENLFYHIQQVVEKCLNAVLVKNDCEVVLSHDLVALLAVLPNNLNCPFGIVIGELSSFAMVRRYEEGVFQPTAEDRSSAMILAQKTLDWAALIVGEYRNNGLS